MSAVQQIHCLRVIMILPLAIVPLPLSQAGSAAVELADGETGETPDSFVSHGHTPSV
jgi:hypothetical protein